MAEGSHVVAGGKRGLLQGIFKSIPVIGKKQESESFPERGVLPTYHPKVPELKTTMGWYPHRIKYKGIFELEGLYRTMARWFKDGRYELHEGLYKSKPPEMELRWLGERKRTGYAKEIVRVHVHMWGDYDLEVIANGRKKKMANVRMVITIRGDIESPYPDIFGQPRWSQTNIERRLNTIFRNWVIKREMEGLYWDRLYYELYDLYGTIKEYLKFGAR